MTKEVKSTLQFGGTEETGLSLLTKLWLSSDDVCKILRISKRTLQNYRDNCILPFSQIGRKIYYKASDIQTYLDVHYIRASFQKGGML
jgi:hypothetical protein